MLKVEVVTWGGGEASVGRGVRMLQEKEKKNGGGRKKKKKGEGSEKCRSK